MDLQRNGSRPYSLKGRVRALEFLDRRVPSCAPALPQPVVLAAGLHDEGRGLHEDPRSAFVQPASPNYVAMQLVND